MDNYDKLKAQKDMLVAKEKRKDYIHGFADGLQAAADYLLKYRDINYDDRASEVLKLEPKT